MSLIRCSVVDLVGPLTARKICDDGSLEAPARLSRAGNVQPYRADELGLTADGMAPDRIIRLYRPVDEVFAPAAMDSFKHRTVTIEHPPAGVDATNWRDVACGDCRDITNQGDHMAAIVKVRDADAIETIKGGKTQMSCGYDFDLDMTPGTSPKGEAYDGIQRNIRGNHVAIVDAARGGPACRIADTQRKDTAMALRIIARDGLSVQVEDDKAAIIEKMLSDADKAAKTATDASTAAATRATDAEKKLADAEKAKADLVAAHDAKVKELEAKILKPEQITALVTERAALIGDAAVLAPDLKPKGETTQAIRAEVIADVVANDEYLKPIAESILKSGGESDPTKASDATLRAAIAALVPMKKNGTSVDDDATSARDRALAGSDDDTSDVRRSRGADRAPKLIGRDLMIRRDYERSRGIKATT